MDTRALSQEERERQVRNRRKDTRRAYWSIGACTLLFLLSATTATLQALYSPYEFYRYQALPPIACPSRAVEIQVEQRVDTVFSVTEVRAAGKWVDRSGEAPPVFIPEVPAPIGEAGRGVRTSAVITQTPRTPGVWSLRSEITVSGRVLGLPASQEIDAVSRDLLTVLPSTDPKCEESQ